MMSFHFNSNKNIYTEVDDVSSFLFFVSLDSLINVVCPLLKMSIITPKRIVIDKNTKKHMIKKTNKLIASEYGE